MTEKDLIETSTAEHFLDLYNKQDKSNYIIKEHSDAPDFICLDLQKNKTLNIEVTMTQDKDKDIQALLGRSKHRNIDSIKDKIEKMKKGKLHYSEAVISFHHDTHTMLYTSIKKKIEKDYGSSVMLVIRDTSPLNWDYEPYIDEIQKTIDERFSTHDKVFDKGIWLIESTLDKIHKLA
jgi:hypothetical protein